MKTIQKRVLAAAAALLFFIGVLCCGGVAATAERRTLRVGYMDYHGFIDKQSDGTYSGYCAEYLAEISKHADFCYEYVYGTWQDLLGQLERHEIDLLCSAQRTPEREAQFDFADYPIGYTQGLLYTTGDNDTLCYEDFAAFDGMTVGALRGSLMNNFFLQYAARSGFSCTLREYDSEEEIHDALTAGEVDAMCSEHLANHTGLSLLARFGVDAYYLISYKDCPFMGEINFALQQIKTDVDFETALYHKYYDSSTAATTIQFTTEEKSFIQTSKPIVVAMQTSRAPLTFYDKKRKTFQGICVDIMEEISRKSGLTFEYVPQETGVKTPDMLASGKYDIICGVERDNFATNAEINASESFLESAIVPVGRAGLQLDLNGALTAAVPSSFQALQKRLQSDYPNLELTYYTSNRDCLNAVMSGKADIFIQNTHILSLLLQEPRYGGLDILPVEIMTEHTALALPASQPPELLSVLNKSIAAIDDATISSSLIAHTFASPYQYTFFDILYKFRIQILIISVLVVFCFAMVVRIAVIQHRNEQNLEKKNRQLAEAVAQADRASVAKGQFLSRMSHEIRTPMNAIVGLTEIARQNKSDPKKMEDFLAKIAVSSRVLLNIINDVLDMSAIESNKLKIASAEFDLKQVLGGISTIFYPQCQSKGVRFEMATDVENEILIGDALRVSQILMNLVSNAYKFTAPDGTIRVCVKETVRKEQTAFLRFTVSDTGCGMTADMRARLFKPFEQETAQTAQKHGGSGLGLSIAKNLVDLMHGAISVESEKGIGTTFVVDIPFEIVEAETADNSALLQSVRVLVVDDDAAALAYTEIVLERIGVAFDTVNAGQEALLRIAEAEEQGKPYHVCLIDWKMPDMNGVEVTRRIRERQKEKPLIIIVSAYDLNEVQEEAIAAGADHFVSKPLFQSTVFNALMTLTNGELRHTGQPKQAYDFTGHRVLLAEDQTLNAEIAMEFLRMVNMEADHAENGREALELFSAAAPGTYDAILMDVQMPELDGYAATEAIRGLERPDAKTIPIFAMTANAFTEDVAAALSAGMNGHIAKPIDTALLYETLQNAIRKAQ